MSGKNKRLSHEELRTFPGFENYTDEEAEVTLKKLKKNTCLTECVLWLMAKCVLTL